MAAPLTQADEPQDAVLAKAAELCGGLSELAYVLDKPIQDILRWMGGAEKAPEDVLREAFTIISSIRK